MTLVWTFVKVTRQQEQVEGVCSSLCLACRNRNKTRVWRMNQPALNVCHISFRPTDSVSQRPADRAVLIEPLCAAARFVPAVTLTTFLDGRLDDLKSQYYVQITFSTSVRLHVCHCHVSENKHRRLLLITLIGDLVNLPQQLHTNPPLVGFWLQPAASTRFQCPTVTKILTNWRDNLSSRKITHSPG